MVRSLSLMTKLSNWQSINRTKQKGFCTILPLAHSVFFFRLCLQSHLPLHNPPCGSWIFAVALCFCPLLPLPPFLSQQVHFLPIPPRAPEKPCDSLFWEGYSMNLNRGDNCGHTWSHNLNFTEFKFTFPNLQEKGTRLYMRLGGWLKSSHCSCVDLWKRRDRKRGCRSKTGIYKIPQWKM